MYSMLHFNCISFAIQLIGSTRSARLRRNASGRCQSDGFDENTRRSLARNRSACIGLDGMRNRSDVIREAVRKYLASPLPSMGDRVEVELGPDLTARMRDFCKLHGDTPSSVLRQAARTHIAKATLEGATVDRVLEMRMDELRARFDEDSNAI